MAKIRKITKQTLAIRAAGARKTPETEKCRNERDDEEDNSVVKHGGFIFQIDVVICGRVAFVEGNYLLAATLITDVASLLSFLSVSDSSVRVS